MSNLVKCVFYYGPGTVRINEYGADLSEFSYHEAPLIDPKSRPLSELKYWVTQCLGFDPETHTVGLHALWTKSGTNVYFYMKPIEGDSTLVGWLTGCEKTGVNPVALVLPVLKDPSSNVPGGGGGGGYYSGQSSQQSIDGGGVGGGQYTGQSSQQNYSDG